MSSLGIYGAIWYLLTAGYTVRKLIIYKVAGKKQKPRVRNEAGEQELAVTRIRSSYMHANQILSTALKNI